MELDVGVVGLNVFWRGRNSIRKRAPRFHLRCGNRNINHLTLLLQVLSQVFDRFTFLVGDYFVWRVISKEVLFLCTLVDRRHMLHLGAEEDGLVSADHGLEDGHVLVVVRYSRGLAHLRRWSMCSRNQQ